MHTSVFLESQSPVPWYTGKWGCFCSGRCWGSGPRAPYQSVSDGLSLFPRAQLCSGTTSCAAGKVTTVRDMLPVPCLWAASGVSGLVVSAWALGVSLRLWVGRFLLPSFHSAKTVFLFEFFLFPLLTGCLIQPCSCPQSWSRARTAGWEHVQRCPQSWGSSKQE